ncbi:unnamed protein product [Moneuplotes crassus]|uniref:Uncharacterized protein n=1 Tax=Euplotes crassus TaxID=5936 RepID=A0AAD1XBL1_EUPCR|nr:unnamed protein product [Moneuplotes crassus]
MNAKFRNSRYNQSPVNPSNGSLISGLTSMSYSPSNVASSTTHSNYLKQFMKNNENKGQYTENQEQNPAINIDNQKEGIFSKFMYGNPEMINHIKTNTRTEAINELNKVYKDSEDDTDEIINIEVKNNHASYPNNYEEAEENYHSYKPVQNGENRRYQDNYLHEGQDTITGLSEIKQNTINQSELNFGQFGGTLASLVNVMNEVKQETGKETYCLERERMHNADPLHFQDEKPYFGAPTSQINKAKAPTFYEKDDSNKEIEQEGDYREKHINHTHSRKSLEENKSIGMGSQIASKKNLDLDEEIIDPDENTESPNPSQKNYNTELLPIDEEVPFSTKNADSRSANGNPPKVGFKSPRGPKYSPYYSLASHSDSLNETFLLCFLMTPRLLRLYTDNEITLPYIFRLSPGPRMQKMFIDHYIFEFLEPESLTPVGSIDLLDIKEVLPEDKITRNKLLEIENDPTSNIFLIETNTNLDCSYYIAGLKLYSEKVQPKKKSDGVSDKSLKIYLLFKSIEHSNSS